MSMTLQSKASTVEPRYNDPRYNDVQRFQSLNDFKQAAQLILKV